MEEAASPHVAAEGFDPVYGTRPLRRILRRGPGPASHAPSSRPAGASAGLRAPAAPDATAAIPTLCVVE
ncbi:MULTISPECIES: hypothetical protein [Streptomyces]|uniref:hypothetical protein n=1 Tax=Streptomyces TaxID=1883 RepID=UPI001318C329|nr:hypothetical protein GPZ77_29660 [Streptomyces sp. QHH-9511]